MNMCFRVIAAHRPFYCLENVIVLIINRVLLRNSDNTPTLRRTCNDYGGSVILVLETGTHQKRLRLTNGGYNRDGKVK